MWSYMCQIEGKDFSGPAGYISSNKAQDATDFLCLKGTMLLYVQSAVCYDPLLFVTVSHQCASSHKAINSIQGATP